MALGPGKYDHALRAALLSAEAKQGLLLIMDGKYGPGFSAATDYQILPDLTRVLRALADQIDKDKSTNSVLAATRPNPNQ